jgi:hypothetical protein
MEWSLAFALLVFVVVSAMTVGAFLIPGAVAAFVAAGVRNRAWPYLPFGLCIGVGALVTVVGVLHLWYTPCRTIGTAVGSAVGGPGPGLLTRGSCGGINGRQWLAFGEMLALVGVAGYVALTRRQSSKHH